MYRRINVERLPLTARPNGTRRVKLTALEPEGSEDSVERRLRIQSLMTSTPWLLSAVQKRCSRRERPRLEHDTVVTQYEEHDTVVTQYESRETDGRTGPGAAAMRIKPLSCPSRRC